MDTKLQTSDLVRFGQFEFDCRTGDLRGSGSALKLQPQPAKVLGILIRRAGQIVTRQELVREVWGADTFVDFDQGLNYAIRQIRTALNDDADEPTFLETLPKRGYRFIAPLETLSRPGVPDTSSESPHDAGQNVQPSAPEGTRPIQVAVFVSIAVAAALIGAFLLLYRSSPEPRPQPITSIAVLPLHNLSKDSDQEYFSDGMTDELITDLANVTQLRVISHTSVERFKSPRRPLPEIARELGVDSVVEGTVMRSGERVRITIQLIDARSDRHLWARSYERDLQNVFALQRDVAKDVAEQVAVKLRPSQGEKLWSNSVDPRAHEAYLKGLYDASKLTPEGLKRGVEYFDQSIALDGMYAPAYAGKAEAFGWAAGFSILPPNEVLPKAKAAALKALELDETLSQAHHALAWANYAYDWDFTTAEAHFKRAVQLNPNDVTAHLWYGMFLAERGRTDESLSEMKNARALDPLSLMVSALGATPLLVARRYDEAIAEAQKVLEMDPANPAGHWVLLAAYERKGDLEAAIQERQKSAILFGASAENAAESVAPLHKAFKSFGAQGYWRQRSLELRQQLAARAVDPYELAAALARVGATAESLALLEKSYAQRSTQLLYWVQGDPAFDVMRKEKRFQEFLRRTRLDG